LFISSIEIVEEGEEKEVLYIVLNKKDEIVSLSFNISDVFIVYTCIDMLSKTLSNVLSIKVVNDVIVSDKIEEML
jgi:hypothetical protein